jgi:sugar diacid utilization regulator/GAF domain-containing protein
MLVSPSSVVRPDGEAAREDAHRALLRYVDRAALDQLAAAFFDAVGLPAAVLTPHGELVSGTPFRCPACTTGADDLLNAGRAANTAVAGWVRCRHGLASVVLPITAPTGHQIATVSVGAVALADGDLATLRRELGSRSHPDAAQRRAIAAVPRSTPDRAEAAARLLAQTLGTVVREGTIASEHAELVATQRQANREISVLYAVSRALGSGTELQAILQRLVDSVGELLGSDAVLVGLIEGDDLVTVASRGLLSVEARHGRLRIGEGLAGRVAASGLPLTCRDMQDDPRQYLTAINSREDLHAFAGVPLLTQGTTVGVLAVYRRVPHDFPESELQLLSHIADQAAVAMERARLYEQERRTVGELRNLHARVEAQHHALQRATAVHAQLTELVLRDAGLQAIVDALAGALEVPVLVEDQFRHRLAVGRRDASVPTPVPLPADPEIDRLYDAARDSRRPVALPANPAAGLLYPRMVAPVIVGGDLLGFLSVVEQSRVLEEPDLLALGHAATVVALEMMKQRTRAEVERRVRGELLEELVSRELDDPEAIQRRAAYLGHNLGAPHALLLFIDDKRIVPDSGEPPTILDDDRGFFAAAIEHLVSRRTPGAMVLPQAHGVLVAAPIPEGDAAAARDLAVALRAEANRAVARSVSVGIGRLCRSPRDFAMAAAEAHRAVALGRSLGAADRVVAFEDLGVYQLLVDLPRPSDAVRFADALLRPLEEYDHRHGAHLLETLAAYLDANGVLQRAAEALSVHVNTLTYRLQRIRELLGVDLNDSDARLGLHLAIKIRQVQRAVLG